MDCSEALPLAMTKEVRALRNDEEKGFSQWRSGDLKDGYELDFARIDGAR